MSPPKFEHMPSQDRSWTSTAWDVKQALTLPCQAHIPGAAVAATLGIPHAAKHPLDHVLSTEMQAAA